MSSSNNATGKGNNGQVTINISSGSSVHATSDSVSSASASETANANKPAATATSVPHVPVLLQKSAFEGNSKFAMKPSLASPPGAVQNFPTPRAKNVPLKMNSALKKPLEFTSFYESETPGNFVPPGQTNVIVQIPFIRNFSGEELRILHGKNESPKMGNYAEIKLAVPAALQVV